MRLFTSRATRTLYNSNSQSQSTSTSSSPVIPSIFVINMHLRNLNQADLSCSRLLNIVTTAPYHTPLERRVIRQVEATQRGASKLHRDIITSHQELTIKQEELTTRRSTNPHNRISLWYLNRQVKQLNKKHQKLLSISEGWYMTFQERYPVLLQHCVQRGALSCEAAQGLTQLALRRTLEPMCLLPDYELVEAEAVSRIQNSTSPPRYQVAAYNNAPPHYYVTEDMTRF